MREIGKLDFGENWQSRTMNLPQFYGLSKDLVGPCKVFHCITCLVFKKAQILCNQFFNLQVRSHSIPSYWDNFPNLVMFYDDQAEHWFLVESGCTVLFLRTESTDGGFVVICQPSTLSLVSTVIDPDLSTTSLSLSLLQLLCFHQIHELECSFQCIIIFTSFHPHDTNLECQILFAQCCVV